MKVRFMSTAIAILLILPLSFAFKDLRVYASEEGHMKMEKKGHAEEMKGHMEHPEVPKEYKGKTNPHWTHLDHIIEGAKIYKEKCAICHGAKGQGDGPLAQTLNPKPADFTDITEMAEMGGDYLFWRVMEGGGFPPFNSQMPAWKGVLTEDEVWKVLSYVHAFSHMRLFIHREGEIIPEELPKKEHEEEKGH